MRNLLKVNHLDVEFDGLRVLSDLSFELSEKETLVVLGPNGAGKTVLLRALLGLVPHQGDVVWSRGTRIGYVPQRVPFNRDVPLTVADFLRLKGGASRDLTAVLAQVGFTEPEFLTKQIGTISSGQFQRILIGWALMNKPDVLLFDEPMAGIDIGGEETIYSLLRKTREHSNLAIIFVTHDLSMVYQQATHVLCLSHQRMICHGSPDEVLKPDVLKAVFGGETSSYVRHQDRHPHE